MAGPRSPTSSVTAQLISQLKRIISLWCCADFQQRSNERMVVLPQTHSRSFHGVEDSSHLDGLKLFKNIRTHGWAVFSQTRPSSFHIVEEYFRLDVMQPCKKYSSLWLGRAPQHPLSRPSSFRGVEKSFRFHVVHIFNNVQMNTWSCFPKHILAHFTVLKTFLIWMVWSYSKTFELMAGPCSPKTRPSSFHGVKKPFRLMLCRQLNTFKLMAGPRSPTSPVTAQLIFHGWGIISFWCCADFQQRSNERMVVLPETHPSCFHGVENIFFWIE